MARNYEIVLNDERFIGEHGETLLDAALKSGVDLPHDCRAGHCGSCRLRLVAGDVHGGEGSEPGVVHACQSRIVGDAVLKKNESSGVRTVDGQLSGLRRLSGEVMEVRVLARQTLPYHPGQYVRLGFEGYPSRPFSITHSLREDEDGRSLCFHVRRTHNGEVTPYLGSSIRRGHRVQVTGPFGAAHFKPNMESRLLLVATNTGFAPIWSIAVAALHENPNRKMMIIVGGRDMNAIYMESALFQLARFPNVSVVATCSTPQPQVRWLKHGRPTDYVPALTPSDVVYVCGAPAMVAAVQELAEQDGAMCYSDPFTPSPGSEPRNPPGRAAVAAPNRVFGIPGSEALRPAGGQVRLGPLPQQMPAHAFGMGGAGR